MIPELRDILKLDDLELNYTVQIADFGGECFTFNVRGTADLFGYR